MPVPSGAKLGVFEEAAYEERIADSLKVVDAHPCLGYFPVSGEGCGKGWDSSSG